MIKIIRFGGIKMNEVVKKQNPSIDNTIMDRTGVGSNALVEGWQDFLVNLLDQLAAYLQTGKTITFQQLTGDEKETFNKIVSAIDLPEWVCGVFIPPSVRNQMMYTNQGKKIPVQALMKTDEGAIIFTRYASENIIINTLLANPPYSAAVDVYDNGALIAGYVYSTIEDCLSSLNDVVKTYFER